MMNYQEMNAKMIDAWCESGWEWGKPVRHEEYEKALSGEWNVRLTPTKYVPHEDSIKNDWGIAFSHTLEEQIGGQLEAGFILTDLYEDTSGEGILHEYNVPTFLATRAVK